MEGLLSRENKGNAFKERLATILERKMTPETMHSYMDRAISDLVQLTDEVVTLYKVKNPQTELLGKELEDEAFAQQGLPEIGEFLEVAEAKAAALHAIDRYIASKITTKQEVITPTDAPSGLMPRNGITGFERPDTQQRLKALLYIVQENGIDLDTVIVADGVMPRGMMRETSYVSVTIPAFDRLVLVCDEEGNASYAFDLKKMQERGISVADIDRMTKEEKNKLIQNISRIGVRFIYASNWMEQVEAYLWEELPEYEQGERKPHVRNSIDKSIPRVSTNELDPWKGFWTDPETGKHWSSVRALALRMQASENMIRETIAAKAMEGKEVVGKGIAIAYCYEDVIAAEDAIRHKVEKEGEWQRFYIDESGKHWGTIGTIAIKVGVAYTVISAAMAEQDEPLKSMTISGIPGQSGRAYCYEDVLTTRKVKEIIDAFPVEKEGDWRGFHTDEAGKHWGPADSCAGLFKIDNVTFSKRVKDNGHAIKKIRPLGGGVTEGYCYEDLLPYFEKDMTIDLAERSGEWRGFSVDEAGTHWGTISSISKKAHLDQKTAKRMLAGHAQKEIKSAMGTMNEAYCYEELVNSDSYKEYGKAPHVEQKDAWRGFYVDEAGTHWGGVKTIGDKLDLNVIVIDGVIKKNPNIQTRKLRDLTGKMINAYAFESIASDEHVADLLGLPKAELSGAWSGFYRDERDRHWGGLKELSDRFRFGGVEWIHQYEKAYDLKTKRIRGLAGKETVTYCYEDLLAIDDLKKRMELPTAEKDGAWRGFWTDDVGCHWTSISLLAKKLGLHERRVSELVQRKESKEIIGVAGGVLNAYCIEDMKH